MNPFVAAQVRAVIEDIRLLEAFVTAPLGLYSDIRMLRQSMPFPDAEEESLEVKQKRRLGYEGLAEDSPRAALQAVAHIRTSVGIFEGLKDGRSPLTTEWMAQAGRVLDRAERQVSGDLRGGMAARVRGLYVVVDPGATNGRPVLEVAEAALRGGAGVVQLRDKSRDAGEVLPDAVRIKAMCDEHSALFIINDDPGMAIACGAHGLHLGRAALPVPEARRVLAPGQLLGLSTGTIDEVTRSQSLDVDYLSIGPIYPTTTLGLGDVPAVGSELIASASGISSQAIVAVGGIKGENVTEVVAAGADCVCVVSAVTLADDPEEAARVMVKAIPNAKT